VPNFVPETRILDIPFLFRDKAHARAVLDGPIGQEMLGKFDSKGFKALAWAENGVRHMTNSKRPVNSPDDLKGLKMRIPGFGGEIMAKLGAVPQTLACGDIYPALEKGTIDATEWVGPYDDEKLGFQKVAKNYYFPGWWEGGAQLDFFINKAAFNALSKENQAIVDSAAAYAHTEMQARYDARNPAALRRLVAGGAKLAALPKAVIDEAFKQSMGLYEELNAKNPNWKKVYTDYAAFRRDQNQWFRVAEASFDRYMQSAKL